MKPPGTSQLAEIFIGRTPILIQPEIFADDRGEFLETYQRARYEAIGITEEFEQDNYSRSIQGVLRGLHLQPGQSKLVRCAQGEIFDVVVDVRLESPSFGKWWSYALDDLCHRQLYIPNGYAHGFYVLSKEAIVEYKCSERYDPARERSLAWNDPEIGIDWPLDGNEPILSARDRSALTLAEGRAQVHPDFPFSA